MTDITLNIRQDDVRLARRGLPTAETWHQARVVAVHPIGNGNLSGFRMACEITQGSDRGFRVSHVVWAPQPDEPQDRMLARLRTLEALRLIEENAEGQVDLDFDQAIGREVEVYVVHVVNGPRVYANGVELRAIDGR